MTITELDLEEGTPMIFQVGEVVSDVYEVTGLLGEGGMGQVFEALDRPLNRRVAIKAVFPRPHVPPVSNEARALAAFRHPSLVTVHTLGNHAGVDYLVMERIYGTSLVAHIHRRTMEGRPIDPLEGMGLLIPIAEGLGVVHRAGLAHRDVKPDNVMLTPDQRVVLMDFGLVVPEVQVSMQTTIAGSPSYMAPEALTNSTARGGGQLLDIYSLGVTAFHLFAGETPFGKAPRIHELGRMHREEPVPRLDAWRDDLPGRLVDLVAELMAKDPHQRPQSAEAVAWQLRAIRDRPGAEAARSPFVGGLDVLIVEDNATVARVLEFRVRQALGEVQVRQARDGVEALEALRTKAPDIMLLDLHMPKLNGIEVCMHMHGEGLAEGCAIIAVSAGAQDRDVQLLHHLGIHHFVEKGERLTDRLAEALLEVSGRPTLPPGA